MVERLIGRVKGIFPWLASAHHVGVIDLQSIGMRVAAGITRLMPHLTDRTREGEELMFPDTEESAVAPAVMDFSPSTVAGANDDFMAVHD